MQTELCLCSAHTSEGTFSHLAAQIPHPLLIVSQSDNLIQVGDTSSNTYQETVPIQISWLLLKPTDLDLHCFQRQGVSRDHQDRFKLSKILFHPFLAYCLLFPSCFSKYLVEWQQCRP